MDAKKIKMTSRIFIIGVISALCIVSVGIAVYKHEKNVEQTNTVILKDNMKLSAESFLKDFQERYPFAYVCKIRWQLVVDSGITYIIEGIEGGTKHSIKYFEEVSADGKKKEHVILGIVERDLSPAEKNKNVPLEKKVNPEEYIPGSKILKIAKENCDLPLQEWKTTWKGGKEYLQLAAWDEKNSAVFLIVDPRTGKVLMKY